MKTFKQFLEDYDLEEISDNESLTKKFQAMSKKEIKQFIKKNNSKSKYFRHVVIAKKVLANL